MKRNVFYVLMISVLSMLFALPALSQSATVKGVAKDAKGTPIADAQVTWHNDDNGRTFKLKTNKKGEYFSLGIDPGTYTVTLTKDGKDIDKVNKYKVGVDEVTLDFDEKQSQEQAVQETAKAKGMTPEQVKQMQEEQAKVEQYNKSIGTVNDKLKAATAAEQGLAFVRPTLDSWIGYPATFTSSPACRRPALISPPSIIRTPIASRCIS